MPAILYNLKSLNFLLVRKAFIISVILLYSFSLTVSGQSLRYAISMPYISLNAYSQKQADVFSFTGNQAALMRVKQAAVGIYGERRFMLEENSAYAVAAAFPSRLGNFGVKMNYAGFKNFNENSVGLAYGRSLGAKFDLGVQFNYYGYRIPTYGNASAINFELGAMMHISPRLNAGFHLYNPVGGKLGKNSDEKLASAYRFGIGYDASDNFFVGTEIIKEEDRPVNVNGGVQYQFKKQFFARVGFIGDTGSGYGGVGVAWKQFRVDIAANYHPQLGFTPGLLLIANFNGRKP